MTALHDRPVPPPAQTASRPGAPTARGRGRGWFRQLLLRLHFLAGLFVGPFILVAALSGAAYALGPTVERVVYADVLTAPSTADPLPLADQVRAAQAYVDVHHPEDTLTAVRPAPQPGATTRVLYAEDGLLESQSRAVFIDPGTTEVRGDELVYGTSGSLPYRTWLSTFHRSLMLGDVGRLYSETAASWLGVVALAGLGLWVVRFRSSRTRKDLLRPAPRTTGYRRTFSWHASTGVWLLLGAVFLSATGITWSQFGGANVSALRSAWGWSTPTLDRTLGGGGAATGGGGEHAGHHGGAGAPAGASATVRPEQFDTVLAAAQRVNVDTGEVEITPPTTGDQAWSVAEIKRSWPTRVDSVAIDPRDMTTVSRTDFASYSIPAKAARWGIDTHSGTMWGLPNQVLLFVTALGIAAMVVIGYAMWWQRRPTGARVGRAPAGGALARAPWWGTTAVVAVALGLSVLLPALGVTLLAFVVVDALIVTFRRPAA
jgi:uncharacterized iron-regulated membrane protein